MGHLLVVILGSTTPADFIQYGALGLIVVAFITGQIVSKSTVERIVGERVLAEKQRDEMVLEMRDTVVPLVQQFNEKLVPYFEQSLKRDERMTREFERLQGVGRDIERVVQAATAKSGQEGAR